MERFFLIYGVMRDPSDELERAKAAAVAAETQLREMKSRLIPRDLVVSLGDVFVAEACSMMTREISGFREAIVDALSHAEAAAVLERMRVALLAGIERVAVTARAQTDAWTIAALELRAEEPPL